MCLCNVYVGMCVCEGASASPRQVCALCSVSYKWRTVLRQLNVTCRPTGVFCARGQLMKHRWYRQVASALLMGRKEREKKDRAC